MSINTLTKTTLADPDALGNDGSQAVYYRAEPVAGIAHWVVHLQGGGECHDLTTCDARALSDPDAMTFNGLPDTGEGVGVVSGDARLNPFAHWGRVYIPYASSDLWSGNGLSDGRYFRGRVILDAVLADLGSFDELLLTGSSAGGVGVVVNLDRVALAYASTTVRGINDAGMLLNVAPYDPALETPDEKITAGIAYWGASAAKAQFFATGLPAITTPLFVQQSQRDPVQLSSLGIDWPLTADKLLYVYLWGQQVQAKLANAPAVGAYSPQKITHGLIFSDIIETRLLRGYLLEQTMLNWYTGRYPSRIIMPGPAVVEE